ncbi:carbohydrate-binding protein [Rubritalea spongiae]|uniref:Carbohydrate-binding protein n=1 Tax=Rubritalea spongiae TaxID=430797 RepID=A0ABW5E4Y9_9BACT
MKPITNTLLRSITHLSFVCSLLSSALADINKNYSYLYFENGYPTRLSWNGNQAGRDNPDLVVQTGYYSLRLDCDTMQLSGFDSLNGSDYLSALNQDVTNFTPATLNLYAYVGNKRYKCISGIVQDSNDAMYVRLIQSGQYVQRFDHVGLVFEASDGSQLSSNGSLEVTAWADHVTFLLDMQDVPEVTRTTVQLISPSGTQHLKDTANPIARLSLTPHSDSAYDSYNVSSVITSAQRDDTGAALTASYDDDEAAYKIEVPSNSISHATEKERIDEFTITLNNPTNSPIQVPLIFDQPNVRAVTGTVMLLANPDDNSPLGIPVQISKNWHKSFETIHMGTWLRGYTMIPLAVGESKTIRLRVVFGYWGEGTFGTASHSQLCLIGWNVKAPWKWDESALGAWGEALTYDPTLHAGRAHMADIRPTFTYGHNTGNDHSWTENAGGGDFLVYYDQSNKLRFTKKMKTCYQWAGPNLTQVHYSGVTDDDKIRYTYTVRGSGSLDYHRKFHKFKYEFQEAVTPTRLLYYQMAADNYSGSIFTHYYRGHATGLMSTYTANPGGNTYKGAPMFFKDRWLSIDDTTTGGGHTASYHRGIIPLSTTLNGSSFTPYMHTYGRNSSTDKLLFDLSAQAVDRSYAAGDTVEGEIAFLMPAKDTSDYWGGDTEFSGRLSSHTQPWEAVYDEFRYNRNMSVSMHSGTLLQNYPLEIKATEAAILADFTLNGGGIGHIPVILSDVPDGLTVSVQRFTNGAWVDYEIDTNDNHDFYQGYYNVNGSMDYAFSFKRPSSNLSASWRMRIIANSVDYQYQAEDYSAISNCTTQSTNSGYTGSGYVDMGGNGSYFEWNNILGGSGGPKTLEFRYAIGGNSQRDCTVSINGTTVGTVSFPSTGSWTTWATASLSVNLPSGNNRIRISASTSAGGPNIDSMEAFADTLNIPVSQAENYSAISGSSVKSTNANFTGSGYVDMGGEDSYFEWDNISGGTYGGLAHIDIRYALASSSNRSCDISVNGVIVGSVAFPSTGSWSTWATDSIPIILESGNNTVRITASTSAGGPNIDKIQ